MRDKHEKTYKHFNTSSNAFTFDKPESNDAVLYLRPHHGLCFRFFEGKGYSSDFTLHMGGIIASLTPDTKIKITAGCDAVCGKCPENKFGLCASYDKVLRYDNSVLELTGVSVGDVLSYGELYGLIGSKIIDKGMLKDICPDCRWSYICHNAPLKTETAADTRLNFSHSQE